MTQCLQSLGKLLWRSSKGAPEIDRHRRACDVRCAPDVVRSVAAMQRHLQRHHSEPLRVNDEAKRKDFVIGLLKAHKWRFTLGVGASVDAFHAATATTTARRKSAGVIRGGRWREARVSKVVGDDITVRMTGASRRFL